MSQKHPSTYIPPPNDYTPRSRPPQAGRYRGERAGRGGNRGRAGYNKPTSFHEGDQIEQEDDSHNKLKNQPRDRFHRNEDDDYFAAVGEDSSDNVNEQVGEAAEDKNNLQDNEEAEEDDPLDAYMKSLEANNTEDPKESAVELKQEQPEVSNPVEETTSVRQVQVTDIEKKAIRLDIDETDDVEEYYYKYVKQTKARPEVANSTVQDDDLDERQNLVDYDKDGNIISVRKVKREIEPLPPIDHSTIVYEKFQKSFYKEHGEIEKLTPEQSVELRLKLEIKVSGDSPPKPVCSFAHFNFDEQLMKVIRRSEYTQPTPIQSQAIPAALLGRNIIGIAMTGSGKTAAYLWPMIVHIMGQPDLKRGDGPIGLVLVPTRELALQVHGEAKKFSKSYKIAVVCAYGGGSKYEQTQDLEAGAEIIVATPGRLIDLIKMNATNLKRVTYLVLDEADRFFEMGFEAQVRSICDQIRPDRQTLLFSATFKKRIEQLARTVTENPIKIVQKALGEANEDVTQHVIVLPSGAQKWKWLTSKLVEFTSNGSVLIFVTRILNAEELNKNLTEFGKETLLLHGDMEQSERNRVITLFKKKEKDIMIATDVAARGLDINHVRTVINYDVARDIDTHTHRVGRTGRAGMKGDAYTLITIDKDKEFAGHLIKNLESSNQIVPDELLKLAMQSRAFRKLRGGSERDSSRHRNHYRNSHHGSGHEASSRSYHKQSTDQQHHHHHQSNQPYRDDRHFKHQHGPQHSDGRPSFSQYRPDPKRQGSSSSYSDHQKRPRWN